MICSDALTLIKSFEGYAKRLPDGGCMAYQERINGKLDIPTIGYGCTKGVVMGLVWTAAEAEAALMRELAIHVERVRRLVTVEINAHEAGALVSFDYNCGGLTDKSGHPATVLRRLNAEDRVGAAEAMKAWNKFGGRVCDGLVRRRAAEVALFLKPRGEVAPDYMPQQPDRPGATQAQKAAAGAGITTAGSVAVAVGTDAIGNAQSTIDKAKQVKSIAVEAKSMIPAGVGPLLVPGLILCAAVGVAYLLHRRSA